MEAGTTSSETGALGSTGVTVSIFAGTGGGVASVLLSS